MCYNYRQKSPRKPFFTQSSHNIAVKKAHQQTSCVVLRRINQSSLEYVCASVCLYKEIWLSKKKIKMLDGCDVYTVLV